VKWRELVLGARELGAFMRAARRRNPVALDEQDAELFRAQLERIVRRVDPRTNVRR
jgi:hypothetical protein